jgi:hypothetical protein
MFHFYHKKYKNKFFHAKKILFLDIFLFLSIFVLGFFAIYFFMYKPIFIDPIQITLTSTTNNSPTQAFPSDTIQSGDSIILTATIHNNSKYTLQNQQIIIKPSDGFIPDNTEELIQNIPNIFSDETYTIDIKGRFFGHVLSNNNFSALLSYTPEGIPWKETKLVNHSILPKRSRLKVFTKVQPSIIEGERMLLSLSVINSSDKKIENITIKLENTITKFNNLLIEKIDLGSSENLQWVIPTLEPEEKAYINYTFIPETSEDTLTFSPKAYISVEDKTFSQNDWRKQTDNETTILRPKVKTSAKWKKNSVFPGESQKLTINLHNFGEEIFEDNYIIIETKNIINKKNITLDKQTYPILSSLRPGQKAQIEVNMPVTNKIFGQKNMIYKPKIIFHSTISGENNTSFSKNIAVEDLKIGTRLDIDSQILYYTADGDQIGRGPNPPIANETTKYWAVIQLKNSTSDIQNLNMQIVLNNSVIATQKSSVSNGKNITFLNNNMISWHHSYFPAFDSTNIAFELSFTSDRDYTEATLPKFIESISVSGVDVFLGEGVNF